MKKIFLMLFVSVFSTQAETMNFSCEAPNLHYVYRFSTEKSLDYSVYDETKPSKVWGVQLDVTATKAGFNTESQDI